MKPIKDCEWKAYIIWDNPIYYWTLDTLDDPGIHYPTMRGKCYSRNEAIKNWEKFARINGITKYKIEE